MGDSRKHAQTVERFNLSSITNCFEPISYSLLAVLIYLSWLWPRSLVSPLLAISSAILLATIAAHKDKLSLKLCYLSGIIVNILGFYWLEGTIQKFGGFSSFFSVPIFCFFVAVSALQFLLFAFLFNKLPNYLGSLRLPLAWVSAEFICPRIFPWELSTPLLGLPILTQIADIAGSPIVSFVLLTSCSILISIFYHKARLVKVISLLTLLILWCGYGEYKINEFSNLNTTTLEIAIIQANVDVVQQGDVATVQQNKKRYIELSRKLRPEVNLIVWPEAVIQDWIHVDTQSIDMDSRLPFFGPQASLLSGALTFESQEKFFNSAILIDQSGKIAPPYHKRILMPYGEYMPFSSIFPWLNSINKNLALFTAGNSQAIFQVASKVPDSSNVKISPLICYEDLIPRLARTATQLGAEILFNLTNDAWFGDGPAAIHHSLIASFRAIENRRFLVRSTNTGLTEVINSIGNSVGTIRPNSEGILEANIPALQNTTVFTKFLGPWLWWLIAGLTCISCVIRLTLARFCKAET